MDQGPRRSAPPRSDDVISTERFERYHDYARRRGTSRPLYYLARCLLLPAFLVWFRLQRTGREHARLRGGMIVASNHRSFLDPFVIAALLPWRRRIQFVAKVELFEKRWQGWALSRLGAFPIRRGQSDETAMETARQIVDRGGTVIIFPEGTRIRTGSLGRPKRGVGRLALETGAAVLPVAVFGSDEVRRGWRIRPRKVKLRAGRPLTFPRTERPSAALAATVTDRIWPNIELQWEWLGGLPPLRKAAVIGAGSWGTAVAVLLARGGLEVELGTRTEDKAREILKKRENEPYLPGVKLPEGLVVKRAAEIELAGCDLVCLAVPSKALPAVVGGLADRIGSRASVLLLSKGFVQPMGSAGERLRVRAGPRPGARLARRPGARPRGGCRDGGARARQAPTRTCARCWARSSTAPASSASGPTTSPGSRWPGAVEERGGARRRGRPALRAQRRRDRHRRCLARVRRVRPPRGARLETFAGLAGVGDLTATVLAPKSRNRQAGELLGAGVPAEKIPARIGQASEGLDSVPLIAETVRSAGVDAPSLEGLAELIEGEIDPAEWIAGLRRAEREREAAVVPARSGGLGLDA